MKRYDLIWDDDIITHGYGMSVRPCHWHRPLQARAPVPPGPLLLLGTIRGRVATIWAPHPGRPFCRRSRWGCRRGTFRGDADCGAGGPPQPPPLGRAPPAARPDREGHARPREAPGGGRRGGRRHLPAGAGERIPPSRGRRRGQSSEAAPDLRRPNALSPFFPPPGFVPRWAPGRAPSVGPL